MSQKPQLSKLLNLPNQVVVFITASANKSLSLSAENISKRRQEIESFLNDLFGETSVISISAHENEKGFSLMAISAYTNSKTFEKHKEQLSKQLLQWASKWGEDTIGMQYNNELFYVSNKMATGGNILLKESYDMSLNLQENLNHHVQELKEVLSDKKQIDPWVIAKLATASKDLQDVTHYLATQKNIKFETGGNLINASFAKKSDYELIHEVLDSFIQVCRISADEYAFSISKLNNFVMFNTTYKNENVHVSFERGKNYIEFDYHDLNEVVEDAEKLQELLHDALKDKSKIDLEKTYSLEELENQLKALDLNRELSIIQKHQIQANSSLRKNPLQVSYVISKTFKATKEIYLSESEVNQYLESQEISPELVELLDEATKTEEAVDVSIISLDITKESSELMKRGGQTKSQQNKIAKVMREFYSGRLYSSSGQKVTNQKQAIAIALNEAKVSKKKATGGDVDSSSYDVQFIPYKGEEIMFEPIMKEYYVNDSLFPSLEKAKEFIDNGAPMSESLKAAYAKGLFELGGVASGNNWQSSNLDSEGWNNDFKNDPFYKLQEKAKQKISKSKDLAISVATRGLIK